MSRNLIIDLCIEAEEAGDIESAEHWQMVLDKMDEQGLELWVY